MKEVGFIETADQEWHLQIGELFDIEAARECLRHCRASSIDLPKLLLFDLAQTRTLHTAGIGAMLHIKGAYLTKRADAVIVYHDRDIGEILHLAHLDRSFELRALDRSASHWNPPAAYKMEQSHAPE
jgi:anti-anti-sigma regulatory factor